MRSVAGRKHICLEEGTQAEWLYELLEPLADEVVVQLPERSHGVKNDSVDAWQRADELRRGDIKRPVYKAPGKFTALRAAARCYEVTQRDMVRGKIRLNALYRSRGVQVANRTRIDGYSYIRQLWVTGKGLMGGGCHSAAQPAES